MDSLQVGDARIEYEVHGSGEPVLLLHPAMIADGLSVPLFSQPVLASGYQLIHYHRRGYQGSTPGSAPLTVENQAADAAALLDRLSVRSAHIVGHSVGAIIALQMAMSTPDLVFSLALLEPPLFMAPGGQTNFEQGILPVIKAFQEGKIAQAIEIFNARSFGDEWKAAIERTVPGGVQQAYDAAAISMREMAAIRDWKFDSRQASLIRQPVLSVVGSLSIPFMRQGRALLHSWMPQTEDFDPVSTHMLQMQDPAGVARGLSGFLSRHTIKLAVNAASK